MEKCTTLWTDTVMLRHPWGQEVSRFWRNPPERLLSKDAFGKEFPLVWTNCMTMANIQSGFSPSSSQQPGPVSARPSCQLPGPSSASPSSQLPGPLSVPSSSQLPGPSSAPSPANSTRADIPTQPGTNVQNASAQYTAISTAGDGKCFFSLNCDRIQYQAAKYRERFRWIVVSDIGNSVTPKVNDDLKMSAMDESEEQNIEISKIVRANDIIPVPRKSPVTEIRKRFQVPSLDS
ncbi:hypothetical protein RRG08_025268 [Elysia crispata]|uniref:Uncharacterized protein n=1 Tax=Elysia crispata TaxID=231223 RepID=A0AAE1ACD0_9GAST|nr:hypothetical protein RRG08_025268 [Elysia crispata]